MSQNDLSVKEAEKVLGVSRKTIYRMRKRGDFPNSYKRDQKIWIPQSDIDHYLRRQQKELPEPEPTSSVPAPEATPPSSPTPQTSAEAEPEEEQVTEELQPESGKEELPSAQSKPGEEQPPEERHPESDGELPPTVPELEPEPPEEPESEPEEELPPTEPELSPSAPIEMPSAKKPEPESTTVYEPQQMKTLQPEKRTITKFVVDTGIIGAGWLERCFRNIREKLEQYKTRSFPEPSGESELGTGTDDKES